MRIPSRTTEKGYALSKRSSVNAGVIAPVTIIMLVATLYRVLPAPLSSLFTENAHHPGLRPCYDLPATETCWNRGQIVERTYDWSQRSCVITRAKSVAARLWSSSKFQRPQSHRALRPCYDLPAIECFSNRGQIVERTCTLG